jgi:hypothetical protein
LHHAHHFNANQCLVGSLSEHREVEQYYIKQGLLFPTYHINYWIGVQARLQLNACAGCCHAEHPSSPSTKICQTALQNRPARPPDACHCTAPTAHPTNHAALRRAAPQTTFSEWPNWRTLDATVPSPGEPNSYDHWSPAAAAKFQVPRAAGVKMREFCGLANYTAAFQYAWGWGSAVCSQKYVFICKIRLPDPNAPPFKFVSSSGVAFNFHNNPTAFGDAEKVRRATLLARLVLLLFGPLCACSLLLHLVLLPSCYSL